MDGFTVDRENLPKPWANPLIFRCCDGDRTIEAEVEQSAAIEYQNAWKGGLVALPLGPERTEDFVQLVENAIGHVTPGDTKRIKLAWSDLHPEAG